MNIQVVARLASGSPAVGLNKLHELGQNEIIDKIFQKCTCELQNKYCGLQCVIGSAREEIKKTTLSILRVSLNSKFNLKK